MRTAARVDTNHGEIREALRDLGWYVFDSSGVGHGFFDLICCKGGRVVFVEVKDGSKKPSKRKLTSDEAVIHARFRAAGAEVVLVERLADLAQFERPHTGYYDAKTAAGR